MTRNIKSIIAILVTLAFSAGVMSAGAQYSVEISGYSLYIVCAAVGFVLHWLMFIPAYIWQTERYFDLTGSISFIATVTLAALLHPDLSPRGLLVCILVAVWAARLGSFLYLRIRRAGKDRRFDDIKPYFFRFLFTWTLAGAWVFLTVAAGLVAATSANSIAPDIFMYLGVMLWLLGFAIEVVADIQKTQFRANPANAEKFITSGMWSRSRHPNYFGEIMLWLGIAVIALPVLAGWQWLTLLSPLFVILLLTRVSGIPMLEKGARERWGSDPAYQQYLEKTPVLIPRLSSPT